MIVCRDGERLRLVTQPDHAGFAADLLSLVRLPELTANPRRADLLRAVRLHDNGWRELDAAPPVDPASGLPYDFIHLPLPLRLEVWERGTHRYADTDPYASLLTIQHALTLFAGGSAAADWRDLLRRLAERREELLVRCALERQQLAADYHFLDLADRLSLVVCGGWQEPFDRLGFTGRLQAGELRLSPFPFAGATTFQVPCRWLEPRAYAGDADLGATLASARWGSFSIRVVAA